jgi:serine/threonine protein kinase/formylglycine-generating enzyme required for sulfatase activity
MKEDPSGKSDHLQRIGIPEASGDEGGRGAESIFQDEYLAPRREGSAVEIDEVIARHPRFEDALRLLHSIHTGLSAKAGKDLGPGDMVGRFEILEVLGEGGFGRVYLARQREPFCRDVALKVLRRGFDTREFLARFRLEGEALAVMNHPGIARLYETGMAEQGRPYFAMEYVKGHPIVEFCDRERSPLPDRLELFRQVCDAVQHAHQNGIIHRDLKPSNILVSRDDAGRTAVKVIDFGLAKPLHDSRLSLVSVTMEPGELMGTWEYMAPEQADASRGRIDTRTDIYALGVLLYQLLSGCLPLESERIRALLEKEGLPRLVEVIRGEEPPRPSTSLLRLPGGRARTIAEARGTDPGSLAKKLRDDLDWVVMKAIRKIPSDRFSGTSELRAEISSYLEGRPISTRPPTFRYLAGKYVRRHRLPLSLACGAILLVAGVLSLWWSIEHFGAKRESRRFLAEARSLLDRHRALDGDLGRWEDRLREIAHPAREDIWQPVWKRGEELELWRRITEARDEVHLLYSKTIGSAQKGLEAAPDGSAERAECRRFLSEVHWDQFLEASRKGPPSLGPGYFLNLVRESGTGPFVDQIGEHKFVLASDPPGAKVYCFVYRESEGEARLVPLPFDCRAGRSAGEPYLEVESNEGAGGGPPDPGGNLQVGDGLVDVKGVPVKTFGDLAKAIEGLKAEQAVPATVLRDGASAKVSWRPFSKDAPPELPAGELVQPSFQLGVRFAAYPLDCRERNLIGETAAGSPIVVQLPEGSYLFVFRKPGFVEARIPMASTRGAEDDPLETVKLIPDEDVPPGFIYVPAGKLATGGDPEAFQSLPWGERRIEKGYFLGRYEVTVGEWLEFVNDEEVRGRIDGEGDIRLRSGPKVTIIPKQGRILWSRKEDGIWGLEEILKDPRQPIMAINQRAAGEYAAWRTARAVRDAAEGKGKPWRFRLPTDLEWERAARGVDRRIFPWGDYMVWSFCSSVHGLPGNLRKRFRIPFIGSFPFDEGIFGHRDLAGSTCEHTSDPSIVGLRYISYRGGSCMTEDEYYFRSATRNGMIPTKASLEHGIRLAADLLGDGVE